MHSPGLIISVFFSFLNPRFRVPNPQEGQCHSVQKARLQSQPVLSKHFDETLNTSQFCYYNTVTKQSLWIPPPSEIPTSSVDPHVQYVQNVSGIGPELQTVTTYIHEPQVQYLQPQHSQYIQHLNYFSTGFSTYDSQQVSPLPHVTLTL